MNQLDLDEQIRNITCITVVVSDFCTHETRKNTICFHPVVWRLTALVAAYLGVPRAGSRVKVVHCAVNYYLLLFALLARP